MASEPQSTTTLFNTFNREYAKICVSINEAYKSIGEKQLQEYTALKESEREEFVKWSENWLHQFEKFEEKQLGKFFERSLQIANSLSKDKFSPPAAQETSTQTYTEVEEKKPTQHNNSATTPLAINEKAHITCTTRNEERTETCPSVPEKPDTPAKAQAKSESPNKPPTITLSDDENYNLPYERKRKVIQEIVPEAEERITTPPPLKCSLIISKLPKIPQKYPTTPKDTVPNPDENAEIKRAKARERMRRLRQERKREEPAEITTNSPVPGTWCMQCKAERYVRGSWLRCIKCHGCWASPTCAGSTIYTCEICQQ